MWWVRCCAHRWCVQSPASYHHHRPLALFARAVHTASGWGYSNKFSSNYDAIFKKGASAEKPTATAAAPTAVGSKASSHDAIFGAKPGAKPTATAAELLTPAGLALLASDEGAFMAAVAAAKAAVRK